MKDNLDKLKLEINFSIHDSGTGKYKTTGCTY
jgi:hypothetical protein